ncbi:MAG: peptidoglycan editing factor PgeF [Gammaproteobacteria bacterium]|nr:peptidoglycan editing factor PgeF [Gammaproteobacteria bacterium]
MTPTAIELIRPDWPAPSPVAACSTTRTGGVSAAPWDSLNLAMHVGDDPGAVAANRALLAAELDLGAEPLWLRQVHGTRVRAVGDNDDCADAAFSDRAAQICVVMTADCLPVLLCSRRGDAIAAAHAGWRGLLAGVLEQTVACFGGAADDVLAWLGPAIGPQAFEVGDDVHNAFVDEDPAAAAHFAANRPGHWLADIYGLARMRLSRAGVTAVYGGGRCTYSDPERFFSYRRDGVTGRMASLIWLQP